MDGCEISVNRYVDQLKRLIIIIMSRCTVHTIELLHTVCQDE